MQGDSSDREDGEAHHQKKGKSKSQNGDSSVDDADEEAQQQEEDFSTHHKEKDETPEEDASKRRLRGSWLRCFPLGSQLVAVSIKTCTLQRRNYGTNVCQCLTPVALLLLILLLQIWVNASFSEDIDEQRHPILKPPFAVLFEPDDDAQFDPPLQILYTRNASANVGEYRLPDSSPGGGVLGAIPNDTIFFKLLEFESEQIPLQRLTYKPTYNASFEMLSFNTTAEIDATLYREWDYGPKIASGYNFALWDYDIQSFVLNVYYNYSLGRGRDVPAMFNLVSSALSRVLTNNTVVTLLGLKNVPEEDGTEEFDLASLAGSFFYMLILHQLLPVFVSSIVYEKEHRLREIMKMSGLKMPVYWVVLYCWNYMLYFCLMMLLIIAGYLFQFRFFTINAFLLYFILFVIWGHTLIALSFLLSIFFEKSRTSTIVCYFIIIAVTFIANYLVETIFEDVDTNKGGLFALSLVPSFALYRGLVYLSMEVEFKGPGLKLGDMFNSDLNMGACYGHLLVEWLVLIIATIYLGEVWPGGYGVKRHPLFFLGWMKRLLPKKWRKKKVVHHKQTEDEPRDVAEERKRAYSDEPAALRVQDIVKQYKNEWPKRLLRMLAFVFTCGRKKLPLKENKPSVDNVAFMLSPGECIGILGPNGAGKTSLISIISGLFEPTSGGAEIFDLDIRSQINKIHELMGVCPQHDILWPNLTANEHLYFYGRLKNLPRRKLKSEVKKILAAVKLTDVRKKKVAKYSGGMKRRLSVAIALIGAPKIVFLDEPSTGLDPKSKRQLWTVINRAKRKSSLLLTTHSMEEAEALCDKLIIMAAGKIRAVGTASELKSRYGNGFKLSISTPPAVEDEAHNFVLSILPQAKLLNSLAGTRTYSVPKEGTSLAQVFEQMETNKESVQITDWGISNTTLEEVFHHVINEDQPNDNTTDVDDESDEESDEEAEAELAEYTDEEDQL